MATSNENKQKNNPNRYNQYSSVGFQMLLTIGLGVWLGIKLDNWFALKKPIFTIICSLLFIAASIYSLIKSMPKE